MDEYQLEIQSLRRTLARLREEEADPALIEEYETEYRNLSSLYKAATDTFDADRSEPTASGRARVTRFRRLDAQQRVQLRVRRVDGAAG